MQSMLSQRVHQRAQPRVCGAAHGQWHPRCVRGKLLCRSEQEDKKGYIGKMDLLDFVTAGPKMRKWYGGEEMKKAQEGERAPQEGAPPQEPPAEPCDAFVMDADGATGEQVVLQLILARAKLRALVRDVVAARAGFGPYLEPVSVDAGSVGGLTRVLRGARSVAVLGRLGAVLPAAKQAGVQRVVLLSTAGLPQRGGLAALFGSKEDALLREPQREAQVAASGLEYVIVRTAAILDAPGGGAALSLRPGRLGAGSSDGGVGISREDLAGVVAAALQVQLPAGSCVVEVVATGAGRPPADLGAELREAAAAATEAAAAAPQ